MLHLGQGLGGRVGAQGVRLDRRGGLGGCLRRLSLYATQGILRGVLPVSVSGFQVARQVDLPAGLGLGEVRFRGVGLGGSVSGQVRGQVRSGGDSGADTLHVSLGRVGRGRGLCGEVAREVLGLRDGRPYRGHLILSGVGGRRLGLRQEVSEGGGVGLALHGGPQRRDLRRQVGDGRGGRGQGLLGRVGCGDRLSGGVAGQVSLGGVGVSSLALRKSGVGLGGDRGQG